VDVFIRSLDTIYKYCLNYEFMRHLSGVPKVPHLREYGKFTIIYNAFFFVQNKNQKKNKQKNP
jgi:hypothetical protein